MLHHRPLQAVVGAGAAGLATTRELLRAGHRPTVFEQAGNIGGVWKYSDEVDDEPCGGGQHTVPGSAYANLRCNLPREVMGLPEFPFDSHFNGSADPRQFCGHEEVRQAEVSLPVLSAAAGLRLLTSHLGVWGRKAG